jgi:hypothetical protein
MDLNYISPNKLLINYGLLGTLFYTAICTFTTFVKCDTSEYNNVYDYICHRKENDTSNDKYFESFSFYFNTSDKVKDIIIEILTVILGTMFSYCHKYFFMMTIKFLTPIHVMFIYPIFYFALKIIYLVKYFDNFFGESVNDGSTHFFKEKFFLDMSGDIFSIIGFLIYLEILQLSFCKLDYNVRNNIITRSKIDSQMFIIRDSIDSLYEEPNDNNDNNDINEIKSLDSIKSDKEESQE